MNTPEDVIAVASRYLGTRWHHQGRSRAGVDCIGLLVLIAQDLGLSVFDQTDYSHQPDGQRLQAALEAHLTPVAVPAPGDVLLIRFQQLPQHVALLVDGGDIIHAYAQARRVVRHRLDDLWRSRMVRAYRFPGVAA